MTHTCDGLDPSCPRCAAMARQGDQVKTIMTAGDGLDDITRARMWSRIADTIAAPAQHGAPARWKRTAGLALGALAAAATLILVVRAIRGGDPDRGVTVAADAMLTSRLGPHARAAIVGPARLELLGSPGDATAARLHTGTLLAEFEGGPGRSLRIEAGDLVVEIVGTLFAIEAHEHDACVAVAHGTVRVTSHGAVQLVTDRQQLCSGDLAPHAIPQPIADQLDRHERIAVAMAPAASTTPSSPTPEATAAPAPPTAPVPDVAPPTAPTVPSADPPPQVPTASEAPPRAAPVVASSGTPRSTTSRSATAPTPVPATSEAPPRTTPRSATTPTPPVPTSSEALPPPSRTTPRSATTPTPPVPSGTPRSATTTSAEAPVASNVPTPTPVESTPPPAPVAPAPTAEELYHAAEVALAAGDRAAADRALARILAMPGTALADQALYERARIAYQGRAWVAARQHLAKLAAIANTPLAEPGRYLDCRIAVEAKDRDAERCFVAYRTAYPRSPHDLDVLAVLVQLAHARAGCAGARPVRDELVTRYPRTDHAAAWRSRCPEAP